MVCARGEHGENVFILARDHDGFGIDQAVAVNASAVKHMMRHLQNIGFQIFAKARRKMRGGKHGIARDKKRLSLAENFENERKTVDVRHAVSHRIVGRGERFKAHPTDLKGLTRVRTVYGRTAFFNGFEETRHVQPFLCRPCDKVL